MNYASLLLSHQLINFLQMYQETKFKKTNLSPAEIPQSKWFLVLDILVGSLAWEFQSSGNIPS